MAPIQIAEKVVARMEHADYIGSVEIAHPGFININLSDAWVAQQVEDILDQGESFGHVDIGQGRQAQVEYISANPTGPLPFGSGRNAVLGDTLANLLTAAGWQVQREYYVNDTGNQMEVFGASLYARYAQALGHDEPLPENGYPGHYLVEMGEAITTQFGDQLLSMDRDEALKALQAEGLEHMLVGIRADAEALGIHFDEWKSEKSLYDDGAYGAVFNQLSADGWLVHREGAIWFKGDRGIETSTDAEAKDEGRERQEDKENVVVRSDGRPTYLASDIAYVWDKLARRGFDWAIYVWGADHHGHVPRVKAVARALGLDADRVTILLYQLVTLKRGGKLVRMGKRTGEMRRRDAFHAAHPVSRQSNGTRPDLSRSAIQRKPGLLRAIRPRSYRQYLPLCPGTGRVVGRGGRESVDAPG
jgi:arginyl-tRNA synthetase